MILIKVTMEMCRTSTGHTFNKMLRIMNENSLILWAKNC